MKSRYYLLIIILISFLISLNTFKIFSIDETSIFLTVIGLIYGLIAAFSISNAWEKFSKIRDAVAVETNSLESLYIYSKYLSDRSSFRKIKLKILDYCKEVPNIEWNQYWLSEKTHTKFRELVNLVAAIKINNEKDKEIFDEVSEELREAAAARNSQLVLSQTKIPKMQWILNIFLSVILVIGLIFLSIPNYYLSIFIVASMIASVLLILFVIYDLDSLRTAEEEVSIAPYNKLVKFISKDKI
ncbi:MAG: DUF4239 domain-containing protein [archaeon]